MLTIKNSSQTGDVLVCRTDKNGVVKETQVANEVAMLALVYYMARNGSDSATLTLPNGTKATLTLSVEGGTSEEHPNQGQS